MDFATIMVIVVACGLIGVFMDGMRGAALGALLGPLGLLIAAVLMVGDKK